MPVLVGGIANQFGRIGSGIAPSNGLMVVERPQSPMATARPALGTRDSVGISRFRKHLNGLTTDLLNLPLGGVTVKIFDAATDILVGSLVSDAAGNYDLPTYANGSYYAWIRKAGSPNVFGGSDILTPG